MGALWHPDAVRRVSRDAGSFQGGGRKLVWHTTEGSSLPAYPGDAPHFTLDPKGGALWQHIPLSRAARALEAGGPNFWNTIQVELIGWADTDEARNHGKLDRAVVNWTTADYAHIAKLARWIEANFGVPRKCGVEFVGHASHLSSLDAVKRYSGHLGHQHVNGNSHWDPGLFNIGLVLGDGGRFPDGPADIAALSEPVARDMGRGDRGDDVRALQAILIKRGYKSPNAKHDGVFDRATEAYVVHFQWRHELHIDGIVGVNTRTALGLELKPASRKGAKPSVGEVEDLQLGMGRSPARSHAQAPATRSKITAKSHLMASPRATRDELTAYVLGRPHGGYSDRQVRSIIQRYDEVAALAGLDPCLVVAQMILETGNLTSEWSQPPRRNPAGIGVTGEPGAGISFATWKAAVAAHVGRLLAYCLEPSTENEAQGQLIAAALAVRPLPPAKRGSALTLAGLAGAWAADRGYATKIARLANEIRGV